MTIEDRIASTLKAAGERIEVGDGRLGSPGSLESNPSRTTPRWVAFAGAFGAVLLVAFGLSLLRPANPRPVTNSLPLSITESGPLVWRRVLDLPTNISVEHLTHGPAGWVALTQNNRQSSDYSNAPILGSADGVEWSELRPGGLPEVVLVQGVAGQADGYLAYGLYASASYTVTTVDRPSNFAEPAIWTSADGIDWSLLPLPLPLPDEAISDVVSYSVNGAGVVDGVVIVVGTEFDEDLPSGESGVFVVGTRAVVWTSDDMENWRLVDGSMPPGVEAVAGGPAGVLAAAYDGSGAAVLWRTSDGISWDAAGSFPSLPGGPLYLQGRGSGYLLSLGPVVMFSTDGFAWSHVEGLDGLIGGGPGGFAAFGSTVQWSPDGQQWREVGPSDLLADLEWTPTIGVDMGAVITPGRDESGVGQLVVGTNA